MAAAPEGIKLKWTHKPEDISRVCSEMLDDWQKTEDAVAKVPLDAVTFENTALVLAKLEYRLAVAEANIDFYQHVSTDKPTRDASVEASKKTAAYNVKSTMRIDVYERIKVLSENTKEMESLDAESQRFVRRTVRDFERKGLDKNEKERKEVENILTEISELQINFSNNLGEENSTLLFSKDELEGMPDDFIESLSPSEADPSKLILTLKYPHVLPIMRSCKNANTRKAMTIAFNSRCKDTNTALIERLVVLRSLLASKLGYSSHSDYVLEVRMAGSAATVKDFLDGLNKKLEVLAAKERKILLAYKREECQRRGEDFDGVVNMWDFRYLMNKVEENDYSVDHEAIKEYFPLEKVTESLLEIYQHLLKLEFTEVQPKSTSHQYWHQDVKLYCVRDIDGEGEVLGYFYLDLHPREGKYSHAACFTLQQSCEDLETGKRQLPVAACVCNFPKPVAGKPKSSLLPHQQVVTFFHEFGHVMHVICAKSRYVRFSGTRVERDFVEAPSQMLENWCWEPETLIKMSGHYSDFSKSLPSEMAEILSRSKDANTAMLAKRQLLFATFDQVIHTSKKADTAKILETLHDEILGIPKEEGTNFAASFGHIAGGYDAQYYGYMWSEVFSMDMFTTMFKGRLMDSEAGMEYRNKILKPGGSKDASIMLVDFLGREPNQEAFLKSKGISV